MTLSTPPLPGPRARTARRAARWLVALGALCACRGPEEPGLVAAPVPTAETEAEAPEPDTAEGSEPAREEPPVREHTARELSWDFPEPMAPLTPETPPAETISARVVAVLRGDRVAVELEGREVEVQLAGVRAAVAGAHADQEHLDFAHEATDYTAHFLLGQRVALQVDARPAGRPVLAHVWLGGRSFNGQLVLEGYANTDPSHAHDHAMRYASYQAFARRASLGGWGLELRGITLLDLGPHDSEKTVHVRGHWRHLGGGGRTWVHEHWRSAPGSGGE